VRDEYYEKKDQEPSNHMDSDDFKGLVDVFRTLLEWSNDVDKSIKKEENGLYNSKSCV